MNPSLPWADENDPQGRHGFVTFTFKKDACMVVKRFMDNALLTPEEGMYSIRKEDGSINISQKSIKAIGGIDALTRRILGIWAELPDAYRELGVQWFPDARQFAVLLADIYELSVWQVAQVISVLSPQNPWDGAPGKDGNKLCTLKVIDAWYMGGEMGVMSLHRTGWGYTEAFLRKAIKVLQGEELDWSTAPKTWRFARLIFDPTLLDIVVCDSHASRICTGNLGNRYHIVTGAVYGWIEEAYKRAAHIIGIAAQALQAALWQFAVDGNLYGVKETN